MSMDSSGRLWVLAERHKLRHVGMHSASHLCQGPAVEPQARGSLSAVGDPPAHSEE